VRRGRTGKEEQISAMATPTKQVKKETTTQPQTSGAGPAYCRLLPYSGVIPVKSVMVEKEMASVLNSVCSAAGTHTDGFAYVTLRASRSREPRRRERERERGVRTGLYYAAVLRPS
jgi:hypothetical protein